MKCDDEELKSAVEYFKKKEGYKKLFEALEKKFYIYGKLSGTIPLNQFNEQEMVNLKRFLGYNIGKNIKISKIKTAINDTKFQKLTLESITEEFNGRKLVYKKEEEKRLAEDKSDFLKLVKENHKEKTKLWLEKVVNKGLLTINRDYEKNKDLCFERLKMIMNAFDALPLEADKTELIAVFAERYTGNPHYFDINKQGYSELIDFLSFYYREFEGKTCDMIMKDDDLLAMAGLIKNEIQISTLEWGFEGIDRENKEHMGLKSFKEIGEPLELSLLNLKNVTALKGDIKRIYIFENPSVFVKIKDFIQKENICSVALICTRGQLNRADYKLLELSKKLGAEIFYAGDFDTEGLLIAQRVVQGYGAKLLCYNEKYYKMAVSNEVISEKRLNSIKNICIKELEDIKKLIEITKKAAYQEALIDEYIKHIQEKCVLNT